MQVDLFNISLGFIEGLALILSPCILPILPIVLAGSLTGSKQRPYGIILGFVLVFSLVTFFSRKLVALTGIDLNSIRAVSYGLLILLGCVMLSATLSDKFIRFTQRFADIGNSLSQKSNPQGGLGAGILFGGLIALIWTPCAGPILAAVIVQTVIQRTDLMSFFTLMAFGVGAATPMLLIALFGRELIKRVQYMTQHAAAFRKLLGLVIMASVIYMIYFQNTVSNQPIEPFNKKVFHLENGLIIPYQAPKLRDISAWINTKPITLSSIKGQVVLIDFWTYSCINCIRTLPYLKAWNERYKNKGLVIIGVHTPEFDFEKQLKNVHDAVIEDGIKYPVALDNDYMTWRNFNNNYWPAHYLINKEGRVVYSHVGEGDYDVTENNIRYLLGMSDVTPITINDSEKTPSLFDTPETYLGYARADTNSNLEPMIKNQTANYSRPSDLATNFWALQGLWNIMADSIVTSAPEASITIKFRGRNVYVVMGSTSNQPIKVTLKLNNQPILQSQGRDLHHSSLVVKHHKLYQVLALPKTQTGELELTSSQAGLELYTFTFGG